MKFTLKAFCLLFITLVHITSCSKEYSFEDNFAKATLKDPVTGDCLLSAVNGSYVKDSILTSTSFIDVKLNVSATGVYTVKTDTVNGFWFIGEGTVDTLGINSVRLFAKGKPAATGTFTFHINFDTSSCPIDVTVTEQAIGGSSVFSFTSATGTCPDVKFNGMYKEGVALDASNTMEFDVNVTATGTYAINLPAVNGISFAGTGTFATVGKQHVVLTGGGTPGLAGTITEEIITGSSTCSYSLDVLPPDNVTNAVFTLNCSSATLNGTYAQSMPMTTANTVKILATVTTPGKYNITTTSVNGVTFTATGTFNTASETPQQITLVATGTPAAKGSFDYPVSGNGVNCSFAVTYAAAPAQAGFTLAGSPGLCAAAIVNGTYTKGIPLGVSNTVVIKVDVTAPGLFSIATNTINGIKFSATGTFTSAGQQDVTLIATGTPTVAGVNTLTPQVGANSCSFDVTVVAPSVNAGIFTCKIDGVSTAFNDRAQFSMEPDIAGNLQLHLDGYTAAPNGDNIPEFQIFIQNNDYTAIKAGTYDEKHYIPTSPTSLGYNIAIDYLVINPDGSAVRFVTSSNLFSTNPPFTIIITSITANRIKGTFSGKLTNMLQGSTITKTITEGVFDLPVE